MRLRHLLLALTLSTAFAAAESPKAAEARYETRAQHDPNGIGKFYLGREIAHVMGHTAAGWLERPEREQEERTDLAIQALALKPGDVVADIGCGSGYYSHRIAKLVAPGGHVFGVDIQQEMLDVLTRRMKMLRVENVKPVLGGEQDPKLPEKSCDMILMVDVYHEIEFPYEMLRATIPALKPGGRLIFIEYRGEDPTVPIKEVHKMTEAQLKKEMAVHPELEFAENKAVLPWQHIAIFRRKP